jgi:FemAB-related protein (PEP-CTERM system-associated)
MLIVTDLTTDLVPAWDTYVRQSPGGLPLHLSGWREVLQKTYSYETAYLLAQQAGRVVGVMPLFLVHSRLVGYLAMTMPGGLCAESDEVAAALINRAGEIARRAGAKKLVLQDTRRCWPSDIQSSSDHVFWRVSLPDSAGDLWRSLDSNIRRQVRLARKNKLAVEIDRTGSRINHFYDVFSRFTHQAGTPVFGQEFLTQAIDSFPDGFNIAIVYLARRPIAAYFQLQMGRAMYGMWGAALRETLHLRPAYLAYWTILEDAVANRYRLLDMGRSPAGSNASKFKAQWGGVSSPVYRQVAGVDGGQNGAIPGGQAQTDGRFQLLMKLWPYVPFSVARYLGPKLRRHVPFA